MNLYFLSVAILLAVYEVVTAGPGGPKGSPHGHGPPHGGPMVREMSLAVICGDAEALTCFQSMSNFAEMKAALEKVEVPELYKQKMCLKADEHKTIRETDRKIHETLKDTLKKDKKDKEEMKPIHDCIRKLRDPKADAPKVE